MKHIHTGKSSESILDKDTILRELDILPGQTILDAGCGNGYMAKEFSRALQGTGRVIALDADEAAIDALRAEADAAGIEVMAGDIARRTPLEASSLDLIYLSTVLHGFSKDEIRGFREEAKRLLKPHGRLAIVEIRKEDTPFGPPLEIRFSPEEMIRAIDLAPRATVAVGQYFYMQFFENAPDANDEANES